MSKELVSLTATEVRALLLARKIAPLDLVNAAAERIDEVESTIHALPTLCLDRAREHALRIEANRNFNRPNWLGGIPIVIKETTDVAGVRTTFCSPIYQDRIPQRSDPIVDRLEANGAIVLAKSNMPEFAHGGSSRNQLFEATRNPWNTSLTAGGSSGGSAAAVASGEAWLAQGTDHGGSLRQPASYCAVVGMRPSPGLITRGVTNSLWSPLSLNGPIARNVADLALLLDAMAGLCRWDPMTFDVGPNLFGSAVKSPDPPRRIAFSADLGGRALVDSETRAICTAAVARFQELGCIVEESAPDTEGLADALAILRGQHLLIHRGRDVREHPELVAPRIVSEVAGALSRPAEEVARAEHIRARFAHALVEFFNRFDLLVTPTVATPAFDVGLDHPAEIDGLPLSGYSGLGLSHTGLITLGGLPAISLPCGLDRQGRPIGLQVAGPPRSDADLVAKTAWLERTLDLPRRLPVDPSPPAFGKGIPG